MPFLLPLALAVLAAVAAFAGLLSTILMAIRVALIAVEEVAETMPGALSLLLLLLIGAVIRLWARRPTSDPASALRLVPTADLYAELARREAAEKERAIKAARRSAFLRPWARHKKSSAA